MERRALRRSLSNVLKGEIRDAPRADLLELIGELERAKAVALVRLLADSGSAVPTATTAPVENLSATEAARRLGVSRDWLYRNANRLPFSLRIGRRLLFSASGLERWNQKRQGQ